ncbi:site-specific integrase [Variovorax sp. YR266]|uniref:site-specific integrase n=1 Tax=unclassified Variovorax TaxID=663243 RepID=UPI00089BF2ED|nr:site-specific integrase [Variovorax sp. YR266]SDY99847.1 Site-specific recombinase XerD [Variovorax sp. YR266]
MASIRERFGTWQARVRREGYPAEVKSFATRTEAKKWARHMETSMDAGGYRSRTSMDKALLGEALLRYSAEVSPTKRGHLDEVIRIKALMRSKMAAFALEKLTPTVVAAFRDERLREVKAGAVIRDLSLLSSVINHARREWGAGIENPCLLVKKPPAPPGRARVLSADEEGRLLVAVAPVGRRNPDMLPLVQLALHTAMRRGELLALEWKHIDLAAQTAYLPVSKNGHPRSVPLSRAAVAALSARPTDGDGRVFSISAQTLAAAFRKATARARVPGFRFHDLRHTATSRMADKLPNVIELAAVTGHRSLQMLKRYYHPSAGALAKKLG